MINEKYNPIFKKPVYTGLFVFMIVLVLTQYVTYKDYEIKRSNEKQRVVDEANLIQNQITAALNYSFSASKILAFIEENYGIKGKSQFDSIARGILKSNKYIDALQLVEGGVITYVYPLEGNEAVLHYNILEDSTVSSQAFKAIEKDEFFIAGPFELKQGGLGMVGRQVIKKNSEFWGFAATIIHFRTFLDAAGIRTEPDYEFDVRFSKNNASLKEQEFIRRQRPRNYDGPAETLFIPEGEWELTVQLKASSALKEVSILLIFGIFVSLLMGMAGWQFARQPAMMARIVEKKSRQLAQSNERFEYAVKATSDAVWDWDFKSGKIYRSDNFKRLFGYENDAYTENNDFWQEHIHPEDRESAIRAINQFIAGKEEYWEHEFRFKKLDGTYAYVLDKGIILRDQSGQPFRMIGATQDITSRKLAELALEKEKEFFSFMLENLSEGIIACDENGKLTLFNKAAREITALDQEKIPAEDWSNYYSLYRPDGETPLQKEDVPLYKAWKGEKVIDQEVIIAPDNLPKRIVICSGGEIRTSEGKKLGAAIVIKDVTASRSHQKDLYNMSQQLLKRAKELELSNAELEQFAYIASHDLQEPLRMITGFLSQIERKYGDKLDEKGKKYIYFATDGAKRMRQVILDLLEYSRIGKWEEAKEPINLNELLENLLFLNKRIIKRKKATITWDNLPVLKIEKTPIHLIFQNLISNALKYHDPGSQPQIHIGFRETDSHWEFAVSDNGIGILPEYLEKVFVIFERLHTQDEYEGTGMGLAICKKITDRLGGNIWLDSEYGKGSKFYFTIAKSITGT